MLCPTDLLGAWKGRGTACRARSSRLSTWLPNTRDRTFETDYLVQPDLPAQKVPNSFTGIIDQILTDDRERPRKQRHTAQRIFDRLRDEYGFTGGYTTVKDYVREKKLGGQEMFGSSQTRRSSVHCWRSCEGPTPG